MRRRRNIKPWTPIQNPRDSVMFEPLPLAELSHLSVGVTAIIIIETAVKISDVKQTTLRKVSIPLMWISASFNFSFYSSFWRRFSAAVSGRADIFIIINPIIFLKPIFITFTSHKIQINLKYKRQRLHYNIKGHLSNCHYYNIFWNLHVYIFPVLIFYKFFVLFDIF